jgi:hypothetical protein
MAIIKCHSGSRSTAHCWWIIPLASPPPSLQPPDAHHLARLQSNESSSIINRHHPCGIRHATKSGLNQVVRLIAFLAIVGSARSILKHRPSGQHRHRSFSLLFSFFSLSCSAFNNITATIQEIRTTPGQIKWWVIQYHQRAYCNIGALTSAFPVADVAFIHYLIFIHVISLIMLLATAITQTQGVFVWVMASLAHKLAGEGV